MGGVKTSILRVPVGVLSGLSLKNNVESLLGGILGVGKGYVKGKIVGLLLGDTKSTPLGRALG